MKYEIGREIFKQRLEDRLNFVFVDVQPQVTVAFENTQHIPFTSEFAQKFSSLYPNKTQNVVVYTMDGSEAAASAAKALDEAGYQFVYFYRGQTADVVLDKGLN